MMAALMKFHNFSQPQKTIISAVWRHKSTTSTSTLALLKAYTIDLTVRILW